MAKTYVDAVKYLIKIKFQIKGIVDKPDIVGAVFGQSEGLLGEEMDLRELQKKGRVGRIEVLVRQEGGSTVGELHVPTSMDMAETSVLAAAIETVDKVGPCECSFITQSIDDVRQSKRADIAKRAKELLSRLKSEQSPEIDTLTEEIRSEVRAGHLVEYGRDRLPAGPEVDSADEVIVVEGRADVVNMLKHGIKNVIGMGGSRISKDIIDLSRRKSLVLFADGDRGGELNARKLHQIAQLQYVAVAPDGKEVEELQQKEIIQSLRRRMPVGDFFNSIGVSSRESGRGMSMRHDPREEIMGRDSRGPPMRGEGMHSFSNRDSPRDGPRDGMRFPDRSRGMPRDGMSRDGMSRDGMRDGGRDSFRRPMRDAPRRDEGMRIHPRFGATMDEPLGSPPSFGKFDTKSLPTFEAPTFEENAPTPTEEVTEFLPFIEKVKGKRSAMFLDASKKELATVPVRDMVEKMKNAKNVHTIVCDGIITKRLVDAAAKSDIKLVVGIKRGKLGDSPVKTLVVS